MSWASRFRELEDDCRRAPSAHNTQPWLPQYTSDSIDIHWDPARALPDSDPTRRDLFLSLGAFVETSLIVAASAGLPVRAEIAVDHATLRAARLLPAPEVYDTPFTVESVRQRRCARGGYAPGTLDPQTLAGLGADLRQVPTRELAGPLAEADRWMFGTPAVVDELRAWMRLSPKHPRYHLDGLTDRAMALSRVEATGLAAMIGPRAYRLTRRLGGPALLAAASKGLLRYDGSVLILVGSAVTPEAVIAHGRELVRVWLALSERGLHVHPLSQLLDCAATSARLAARLDLAPDESPLAVFRTGRPLDTPVRSARIPAA
ncbi:hypothetical protein ACFO1B_09525 [Dactylosporangium siamense]|uniref:Nitroreductase n=1 Tax=Dactylosporangium siamense TaxID=685454 RepID=A0A919PQP9_9ACTN|nr:hypothetical protein [Dactylosporangium siamense]GIG48931.1 hypothetical protein Dsi01nite_069720 [Dactylosporangium siamense]